MASVTCRGWREAPRDLFPAAATVIAAIVPLIGVVVWNWGIGYLFVLYWVENVVVGTAALPRSAVVWAHCGDRPEGGLRLLLHKQTGFVVFYGLFTAGHGVFVSVFVLDISDAAFALTGAFWLAVAGTCVQHAVELYWDLIRGEVEPAEAGDGDPDQYPGWERELARPLPRMFVLHVVVTAGALPMMVLQQPLVGLVSLVLLKAGLDLRQQGCLDWPRIE